MSREAKHRIYEQFARIGKALASPNRLELLDFLGQGEWSVETLAGACELSVANASQHLQTLYAARLVESRRAGQRIFYRLADPSVATLWQALRKTAQQQLAELDTVARQYLEGRDDFEPIGRAELVRRMKAGSVTLIDVRPREEYEQAHLPGAVCVPLDQIKSFARQVPKRKQIVAYCRGPYCIFALKAVAELEKRGLKAARLEDGVQEWRAAGLPLESGSTS